MTSTVTRRGLVAAAPAVVATSALPGVPRSGDTHSDAELLALRPKWRKAWLDYERTFEPVHEAEQRHSARSLAKPDRQRFAGTEARYAMAVALVMQRNEELETEVGLVEAKRLQSVACEVEWDLADQVFAIPARTAEGIRFKLEILMAREGCESEEMEPSLRSDLLQMAGIHDA